MSGVYRMLQNTAYGNLRPMGSNIDLGGGFKPTDANGNVLSSQQIKQIQAAETSRTKKLNSKTYSVGGVEYDINTGRPVSALKNQQKLKDKRPWWDKMGWFGGTSGVVQEEQRKKQELLKKNSGATLYNKPRPNTGTPYKSRFARPTSAESKNKPVKPPVKPTAKPRTKADLMGSGGRSSSASSGRTQRAPSPSPRHPKGTGTTQRTTGTKR